MYFRQVCNDRDVVSTNHFFKFIKKSGFGCTDKQGYSWDYDKNNSKTNFRLEIIL